MNLKAHFDDHQIILDELFKVPPNSPLIVTVLSSADHAERTDWSQAAIAGLSRAYADNEPNYSPADVKK